VVNNYHTSMVYLNNDWMVRLKLLLFLVMKKKKSNLKSRYAYLHPMSLIGTVLKLIKSVLFVFNSSK
jgi:hypothetical protein